MRCEHCKAPQAEHCRGLDHRVFCAYMDPASPSFAPAFARILVADDVQVSDVDRALMAARAEFDVDFIAIGGCGC